MPERKFAIYQNTDKRRLERHNNNPLTTDVDLTLRNLKSSNGGSISVNNGGFVVGGTEIDNNGFCYKVGVNSSTIKYATSDVLQIALEQISSNIESPTETGIAGEDLNSGDIVITIGGFYFKADVSITTVNNFLSVGIVVIGGLVGEQITVWSAEGKVAPYGYNNLITDNVYYLSDVSRGLLTNDPDSIQIGNIVARIGKSEGLGLIRFKPQICYKR